MTVTATGKHVAAASVGDDGLVGIFGPTHSGWAVGTLAVAANAGYLYRIYAKRRFLITLAEIFVTTASGADDPCEVAVFNADGSAKLATTGATSGKLNALGAKTLPLVVTLEAGSIYNVHFAAGAAGATLSTANVNSSRNAEPFGSGPGVSFMTSKAASYPAASTLSGYLAAGAVPLIALRES